LGAIVHCSGWNDGDSLSLWRNHLVVKNMKKSLVRCSCVLILLEVGAVQASDADSRSEAERYITANESAWAESVPTNNSAVLKRILADDCVWVLDGKVLSKAAAVADAEEGPGDFVSNHLDYAHVRFFGDTAIVQGSETWTRKGGQQGHFVWIDTWVLRHGQWQIEAAEDVSVPIK
jgi:hypothetical protein